MSRSQLSKSILNVPNTLSFIRIILIPVFVYFFFKNNLWAASGVLLASGLSDMFDGYLARKLNQITEMGKILDPIADKLTLCAVVVCMWARFAHGFSGLGICFTIMATKELIMCLGSLVLLSMGTKPTAAKWYGKLSTVFFYCVMLVLVLFEVFKAEFPSRWLVELILVAITTALALFALGGYVHTAIGLLKEAQNQEEHK
ncbi:MAG: CDP-alcohol phosphatidyltransferase family protein [Oscillospiraceae bacterium]|jgi:cardiolipin synthase|nr:CDP-alcohol phosphatidyltransferase family protein [Oscillospiraceae bacterium]